MFLGYIHAFRALAIFFIVAGHSIDAFIWPNSEDIEKLLRILISNGSTLFIFIAGYLFQHLAGKYDTKKYFSTKLRFVILPYILISIPAILIFTVVMERETVWEGFYDNPIWQQVGWFYLTGKHLAPLWFVPMITIYYLIAPLMVRADHAKWIYFALPLLVVLSCFIDRGFPIQSAIHFFSTYLLGMFCSRFKDQVNPLLSRNDFLLFSLAAVSLLAASEFYYMEGTMSYLNFLQKMVMSLFFLGLFFKFNSHLEHKLIGLIADTSFGVFFIHSYVLTSGKISYTYFFEELPEGNIAAYFLIAMATLSVSIAIISMTKKIFGKNSRYLVGS